MGRCPLGSNGRAGTLRSATSTCHNILLTRPAKHAPQSSPIEAPLIQEGQALRDERSAVGGGDGGGEQLGVGAPGHVHGPAIWAKAGQGKDGGQTSWAISCSTAYSLAGCRMEGRGTSNGQLGHGRMAQQAAKGSWGTHRLEHQCAARGMSLESRRHALCLATPRHSPAAYGNEDFHVWIDLTQCKGLWVQVILVVPLHWLGRKVCR